ncbi:MAG: HNH endonuclease [Bacteriovoracaceae bacterium]|nr:HNH endonuclease [Bacteriovoracaceae bacterium]
MNELKRLSDAEILKRTEELVLKEKEFSFLILKHLAEIDRRRVYADLGYASLYDYCFRYLKYSEYEAYGRISALKLMRGSTNIETKIKTNQISLTNLIQVAKFIGQEEKEKKVRLSIMDKEALVDELKGKSTREVRHILHEKAATPKTLYHIKIHEPTLHKFRQYQSEVGHYGEEDVLNFLLDEKLYFHDGGEKLSSGSRYLPQKMKYLIYQRAKGQCEYQLPDGKRCHEHRRLQFDHIQPYALGGKTSVDNIRLYCRAHNQRAAIKTYGQKKIQTFLN